MGLRDRLQRLLRLHREGRTTAGFRAEVLEQGGPDPELPLVPGEPEQVRERLGRLAQGALEAGRGRGSEMVLLERLAKRTAATGIRFGADESGVIQPRRRQRTIQAWAGMAAALRRTSPASTSKMPVRPTPGPALWSGSVPNEILKPLSYDNADAAAWSSIHSGPLWGWMSLAG